MDPSQVPLHVLVCFYKVSEVQSDEEQERRPAPRDGHALGKSPPIHAKGHGIAKQRRTGHLHGLKTKSHGNGVRGRPSSGRSAGPTKGRVGSDRDRERGRGARGKGGGRDGRHRRSREPSGKDRA